MAYKLHNTQINLRKKLMPRFLKYFYRVSTYLTTNDEKSHKIIVNDTNFIDATYLCLIEGNSLDFEFRKEISETFKNGAKIKNLDGESIVIKKLLNDGRLEELRNYLLPEKDFASNGMLGLMGNLLRFFAKMKDSYKVF